MKHWLFAVVLLLLVACGDDSLTVTAYVIPTSDGVERYACGSCRSENITMRYSTIGTLVYLRCLDCGMTYDKKHILKATGGE